jgi:hypothetical protein
MGLGGVGGCIRKCEDASMTGCHGVTIGECGMKGCAGGVASGAGSGGFEKMAGAAGVGDG